MIVQLGFVNMPFSKLCSVLFMKLDVSGQKVQNIGSLLSWWASHQSQFTEKPQHNVFSGPHRVNGGSLRMSA